MPIFCTQCGQRNAEDANFCESCGAPLTNSGVAGASPPPSDSSPKAHAPSRSKNHVSVVVFSMIAVLAVGGAVALFSSEGRLSGILPKLGGEPQTDASEREAIERQRNKRLVALRNKDVEGVFSIYTLDYTRTDTKGQQVSLDEVRHSVGLAMAKVQTVEVSGTVEKITVKGDMAVVIESEKTLVVLVNPQTGKRTQVDESARDENLWVKKDGVWKLHKSRALSSEILIDGKRPPETEIGQRDKSRQTTSTLGAAPSKPVPPTAKPDSQSPSATGVQFRMLGCYFVGGAVRDLSGLPNNLGPFFVPYDRGLTKAQQDAIKNGDPMNLARAASAFAKQNVGNCPPQRSIDINLWVLIFKDRIPEKIPTFDDNSVTSIPGLLMYARQVGAESWALYNVGFERTKLEKAQAKNQAAQAAFEEFMKRNKNPNILTSSKLKANPFSYEGHTIAVVLASVEMRSASSAVFGGPMGVLLGPLYPQELMLVTDVPRTLFSSAGVLTILVVKVIGTTILEEPSGKRTVPKLQYLDSMQCQNDRRCEELAGLR